MTVAIKILTIMVQLACLVILLIKGSRKDLTFCLSMSLVCLLLLYNSWTLILMLSSDFSSLQTHRFIGSVISIVNYGLLFMLMRRMRKLAAASKKDSPCSQESSRTIE